MALKGRNDEGEGLTLFSSDDLQQPSEIENVVSRPFGRGLKSELELERSDDGLKEVLFVSTRKFGRASVEERARMTERGREGEKDEKKEREREKDMSKRK